MYAMCHDLPHYVAWVQVHGKIRLLAAVNRNSNVWWDCWTTFHGTPVNFADDYRTDRVSQVRSTSRHWYVMVTICVAVITRAPPNSILPICFPQILSKRFMMRWSILVSQECQPIIWLTYVCEIMWEANSPAGYCFERYKVVLVDTSGSYQF